MTLQSQGLCWRHVRIDGIVERGRKNENYSVDRVAVNESMPMT